MKHHPDQPDGGPYLPAREVLARYRIADRTLDRWITNGAMQFPAPLMINRRRYFSQPSLVEWERQRASKRAVRKAGAALA